MSIFIYLSMKSSEENYPSLFMDFTMCVVISDYFCYDYIDTGPYINKALNVEVFHSETDVFPILCAWTRLFSDWSVSGSQLCFVRLKCKCLLTDFISLSWFVMFWWPGLKQYLIISRYWLTSPIIQEYCEVCSERDLLDSLNSDKDTKNRLAQQSSVKKHQDVLHSYNTMIRGVVTQTLESTSFFDVTSIFMDGEGNIRLEMFKSDLLHLSAAGIEAVCQALHNFLKLECCKP
ncbi:Ectopic P granules protein 5-like protein [Frankliniella fusca]|uniref:Ectopic P granules protein 5-like protein n=1 Tax=Frankliniella fusca TaxID=407009 RepID=A0AAE1HQS1_9NEOP|nr:Ectopic P granules protein 5-like protein [Frankliniella fusca]